MANAYAMATARTLQFPILAQEVPHLSDVTRAECVPTIIKTELQNVAALAAPRFATEVPARYVCGLTKLPIIGVHIDGFEDISLMCRADWPTS